MIDGYIMHVQGLSWRRLGADEMGGEQVSARRQKTSEEGQDMRNPWHQNSVKGKSQTYVVCVCVCVQFIPKCTKRNTGGGFLQKTLEECLDAIGLLVTLL